MSWSTDIATLKSTIEGLSYSLVPENKEVNEMTTFENKIYSIKLDNLEDIEFMTANKVLFSHFVVLKVGYKQMDDTQLRTNEAAYITLFKTLAALASLKNITVNRLEMIDNKHSMGSMEFYYGQDGN